MIIWDYEYDPIEVETLNDFLKKTGEHSIVFDQDYIAIRDDEQKLYSYHSKTFKVLNEKRGLKQAITVSIDIELRLRLTKDVKHITKPKSFSLHGDEAKMIRTLLKLKPDKLLIEYWPSNLSEYMRKHNINMESLIVKGYKTTTKTPKEIGLIRIENSYNSRHTRLGNW